jgi:rod shape-determining protein MreC
MLLKLNKRRLIIYVAVVALLIFLYLGGVWRPVEFIFTKIFNPVSTLLYKISSSVRLKYNEQTSKTDLSAEVKKLNAEIVKLSEENASLKTLEEENSLLRDQLGFLKKSKNRLVVANVVGRGDLAANFNRTETIIIDKGSSDGLYSGLPVVAGQGVIIGKIAAVKDNIAQVILTNNKNCKLAATILNSTRTSGIVQGELGLTIKMGFIPQDLTIRTGDIVITSGLEQAIPRGLVIGHVMTVNRTNNELWQEAILEPLVDPNNLIIVSVLLS